MSRALNGIMSLARADLMSRSKAEEIIEQNGRRLVCRAVEKEGELQDAILVVAMRDKLEWTPEEVEALLAQLDRCTTRLSVWLSEQPA